MRASELSDQIWNGIGDLVKRSASPREIYFATVTKVDKNKKLIYTDEHGGLGIPMLTPNFKTLYYDTQAKTVEDSGSGLTPGADDTVATSESGAIVWQKVGNAMVASAAAIDYSKLNLTGSLVNADVSASAAIAKTKLALTGTIVNADISASAAIAYTKLSLALGIVNGDISTSAAIAYAKLALTGSIVDADVASGAAIAKTKLALTGTIVNADVSASAAISYSKLSLAASILNADISASAAIAYSKLSLGNSIVNADIATGAAIVYSKLSLTGALVNADVASGAAIAYSKLNLAGSVVNADIATGAAIAYSKLALTGSILNADINASAAIAASKLASYPSDGTKALFGDGTWKVPSGGPTITKQALSSGPPSSPATGDIWYATWVLNSKTYYWQFVYLSGETYPWKYIGGPSYHAFYSATIQNSSDATWQLDANAPRYTIVRTGQYHYQYGGIYGGNNAVLQYLAVGLNAGAIYAPYTYASNGQTDTGNVNLPMSGYASDLSSNNARSAADVIALWIYSTAHTNTNVTMPYLAVTPIAIS